MADPVLPKSSRRWLRLSVRGLIVLVLILGGGLGWVIRAARIQRDAVEDIERQGAGGVYEWH